MEEQDQPEMKKISLGILVGAVVLGIILYGGYLYAQKKGGKLVLPGGTYLGTTPTPGFNAATNPPTAPLRFTATADIPWVSISGLTYPYSFSYPETLSLSRFPNDPADSIAINWGNIPPEFNILLNVEKISARDSSLIGKPETYARDWWKAFPGLKGVQSVQKITNANGLTGYKAVFVNSADQSPNVDVFFAVPENQDLVIHIANGVLDTQIFNRMIDSVKYTPAKPTPTTAQ